MKLKLIVFFTIVSYGCYSQVAGYLGKRFSIGYSNYFMVAGLGPVANAPSKDELSGLNSTHCLNLEYTIQNRTNFCISFQTLKTGVYPTKTYIY